MRSRRHAARRVTDSSLLGTQIGNYVITQRLGEGGMGAVYRAVQPSIGAQVAIKVLHATPESQRSAVDRFLLEARAVNSVAHPNLIKIIDTGELPDRRPYLVMELLEGITLSDAIGTLSWANACLVAADALEALDAVHARGLRASRSQAREHLPRPRRPRGGARLRHRQAHLARGTVGDSLGDHRHARVHGARADPLASGGSPHGRLRHGRAALRGDHRQAPVHRRRHVRHARAARGAPAALAARVDARAPRARRGDRAAGAHQGSRHRFSTAAAMAAALRTQLPARRTSLANLVDRAAPAPSPLPSPRDEKRTTNERGERTGVPTVAERPRSGQKAPVPAPPPPRLSRTLAITAVATAVLAAGVVTTVILRRDRTPAIVTAPVIVEAPPAPTKIEAPPPPAETPVVVAKVGDAEFVTVPEGATVEIGGPKHRTPTALSLPSGEHTFTITREGYQTIHGTQDVEASVRTIVHLSLVRKPAPPVATTPKPLFKPSHKPPVTLTPAANDNEPQTKPVEPGAAAEDRPKRKSVRERQVAGREPLVITRS